MRADVAISVLQLIIPGSEVIAGSEEAKRMSLPEYAGVHGVEEAEKPVEELPTQGGWGNSGGINVPGFSGADGVKQEE